MIVLSSCRSKYIYLEICDEVIISCGAIAEKDLVALELSLNECGNTLISNNKYFVNLPVLTRILKFARRPKTLIDLIKQLSYLFSSSICPLTLFRRCVRNLSDASLIYQRLCILYRWKFTSNATLLKWNSKIRLNVRNPQRYRKGSTSEFHVVSRIYIL